MNERPADVFIQNNGLITDIVSAVAEREGCDPAAMTPPLTQAIDPDALQQLLKHSSNVVTVSFEYKGWAVDVIPGGRVTVQDANAED